MRSPTTSSEFERSLAIAAADIAHPPHLWQHGTKNLPARVTVDRRCIPAQDIVVTRKQGVGGVDRSIRRRLGMYGDRGIQSITTPRKCFVELRILRRITQRVTQSLDRGVEAVLVIDERLLTPQLTTQVVTCHQ